MADIAIIGAGVSGLSAGIYARLAGYSATIYERHSRAGGNLTGWDRGGYHIDNCIHWLTGTNPNTGLYKMWQELGVLGDVPIYQGNSLYTFQMDGQQISLSKSIDCVQADMLRIAPEDRREILSFIKAVKAVQALNGISDHTVFQQAVNLPSLAKYYTLSTGELAKRFSNPVLRGFLSCFMTEYFSSLALIMVFATFTGGNGGIPEGSSCAMARRMEQRFTALGGDLRLGCGAAKINLQMGKAVSVTLENGTTEKADYVILATDPAVTFGSLLSRRYMPKALKNRYEDPRLLRFSSFHCAFACDASSLPFASDVIFEMPEGYQERLGSKYLILREFSHEKTFAPEGKNILQTMIYCMEETCQEFICLREDRDAYSKRKQAIAEDIQSVIECQFPQLAGTLQCIDVWTPATYRRYMDSQIGSYMGFAFPEKTLPRRLSCEVPGLSNVVLGTQWLQAPGGLPIAARAGRAAVEAVVKKERNRNAR